MKQIGSRRIKIKNLLRILVLTAALVPASVFAGQWLKVASDEGRFSLLMPGTPEHKDDSWGLDNKDDTIFYSFSFVDLVKDDTREPRTVLAAGVKGSVAATKGSTLISENYFQYQGYPACEYRIKMPKMDSINRVYLVNHRLYIAVYVAAKNLFSKTNAGKFHDSLRFLNPELNTGK
jgi:hypothetical protein